MQQSESHECQPDGVYSTCWGLSSGGQAFSAGVLRAGEPCDSTGRSPARGRLLRHVSLATNIVAVYYPVSV